MPFFYPFNILRNLAIETIDTTHYLLLDVDVFMSGRYQGGK